MIGSNGCVNLCQFILFFIRLIAVSKLRIFYLKLFRFSVTAFKVTPIKKAINFSPQHINHHYHKLKLSLVKISCETFQIHSRSIYFMGFPSVSPIPTSETIFPETFGHKIATLVFFHCFSYQWART